MGLVPKKAMLDTAEFYIKKEKLFILEEEQKIRLVMWLLLVPRQVWDHETDSNHRPPPASQSGTEQKFGTTAAPRHDICLQGWCLASCEGTASGTSCFIVLRTLRCSGSREPTP